MTFKSHFPQATGGLPSDLSSKTRHVSPPCSTMTRASTDVGLLKHCSRSFKPTDVNFDIRQYLQNG